MVLQVCFPEGGVQSFSLGAATQALSATTAVDTVANTAGVTALTLPVSGVKVGQIKTVSTSAIAGTSVTLSAGAGGVILNGNTVVSLATILAANAGAGITLQHQAGGTWRIVSVQGVVGLA